MTKSAFLSKRNPDTEKKHEWNLKDEVCFTEYEFMQMLNKYDKEHPITSIWIEDGIIKEIRRKC